MTTLKKLLFLKAASGGSPLYERTIINNPAVFTTEVAKPLKGLSITFTSESGLTGLNISRTGKNLLNAIAANIIPFESAGYDNYTLSDGTVHITGQTLFGFKVPVEPGIDYRWSFVIDSGVTVEAFDYSAEPDKIRNSDHVCHYQSNKSEGTISVPVGSTWIALAVLTTKADVTISDIQIEVGTTTTAYEPYTGTIIPVSWQTEAGTVYGGTLDALTGVLTVTSPESKTVQLAPISLSTLIWKNVIWTDTNSVNTIVYLSKTQGGGFGGGFGNGSDEPGDPEIPEEPVTDE